SFIAIFRFMAKYPEHAEKVYAELQTVDIHDANALASLSHMTAVIKECLRLLPPVLTGNGRVTGPGGLVIDGTFIPAYTKVNAPKDVSKIPEAFIHPDDFIPERWYSRPELIIDKRAFRPFGVGNRTCVGKTFAWLELRLVTAILLHHFTVEFAPGYNEDDIFTGLKDHVTAQPGRTMCLFHPRTAAK
ncbi:cytochrome P450, partial [Mytilinidion resinicola]